MNMRLCGTGVNDQAICMSLIRFISRYLEEIMHHQGRCMHMSFSSSGISDKQPKTALQYFHGAVN